MTRPVSNISIVCLLCCTQVHYNIAKVAEDRDAAIASYRRALELNPRYEQAMNNLANILKDSNQLDEAKVS